MKPAPLNRIERHQQLRAAETKALQLFAEVETRQLVCAGVPESALNAQVYALASELFGVKKYWHKRIVRAGANTLHPYRENPPDRLIQPDDIVFFDFGPVFEDWEADLGRTYVLGNDPIKARIRQDIEEAWHVAKAHFMATPNITGAAMYRFVVELTHSLGWEYPQAHCGHLIGNFPHEELFGEDLENYIHPENRTKMRDPDKNGNPRDWILEIHFVDRPRQIGGFFEQLLNVD
jgi:Xaa-Pro dipeptidase